MHNDILLLFLRKRGDVHISWGIIVHGPRRNIPRRGWHDTMTFISCHDDEKNEMEILTIILAPKLLRM